jgi:hypothetical protein
MENKYSSERPVKVERVKRGYTLNYNVKETSEEELLDLWLSSGRSETEGEQPTDDFKRENKYVYNSVYVAMGQWKYDGLVNAIIRDKYREDEMEAITNNLAAVNAMFFQTLVSEGIVEAIQYLRDSYKSDDTERFKEMQEWRHMAKQEAKTIFKL